MDCGKCKEISANKTWTVSSLTMDMYGRDGPSVNAFSCYGSDSEQWIWNTTDRTVKNKRKDQCLFAPFELEVWAGLLYGGSQAVLLLNRGASNDEQITVKWSEIDFMKQEIKYNASNKKHHIRSKLQSKVQS